ALDIGRSAGGEVDQEREPLAGVERRLGGSGADAESEQQRDDDEAKVPAHGRHHPPAARRMQSSNGSFTVIVRQRARPEVAAPMINSGGRSSTHRATRFED